MSSPSFTFVSFGKTKHFSQRQELRFVADELIHYALRMCVPRAGCSWYIVTRSTLRKLAKGCVRKVNTQLPLILVVDQERLVTCYHSKVFVGVLPIGHQVYYI